MSIRIMSAIWERAPFKGTELLMFLGIADHANDEGIAYPGVDHLARKARVGKRRAQQILDVLISEGAMSVVQESNGRGKKKVYQIAPFYLPDPKKGALKTGKGEAQGAKGEEDFVDSYSESSLNQLTIEEDIKNKNPHAALWAKCFDQLLLMHPGELGLTTKWGMIFRGMIVASREGDVLKLRVATSGDAALLQNRWAKQIQNLLRAVANSRLMTVLFVAVEEE